MSYYRHNTEGAGEQVLSRLLAGENGALVTDAGTPAVSDPGEDLVALCAAQGVTVTAIPGPCALVTALAVSGLPTGRFTFEGFLPMNKKNRRAHLDQLRSCEAHSSVILSPADSVTYKKLGMRLTCEPTYETNKLYHK